MAPTKQLTPAVAANDENSIAPTTEAPPTAPVNQSQLPPKLPKAKSHANAEVKSTSWRSTTLPNASTASAASIKQNGPITATVVAPTAQPTMPATIVGPVAQHTNNTTVEQNGMSSDAGPSSLGGMLNGNGSAVNKRTSKQKWVPLAIDIAKTRSPRYKRRDGEHDDDYYTEVNAARTRRYRPTTYRGGKSGPMGRGGGGSSLMGRRPVSSGGTGAKVIRRSRNHPDYMDYPSEFSLVNKATAAAAADIPPYMMPYLGTFYYNGVPSYANMDAVTLKDAIKKQM